VPIDAILFGGRRASVVPLVIEAFDWQHGTFLGATASSETTFAAAGKVGQLRRDPMAMLPFCGYHMGDYFAHWLKIGAGTEAEKLPRIYYVNWFRRDANGNFLWPGYGENSRVLKWIFERADRLAEAVESPIGRLPASGVLDVSGLQLAPGALEALLKVDLEGWLTEVPLIRKHFETFGDRLPGAMWLELSRLQDRLLRAHEVGSRSAA
jgi:phosphoenolpyruvate carboxykinase (GTP)